MRLSPSTDTLMGTCTTQEEVTEHGQLLATNDWTCRGRKMGTPRVGISIPQRVEVVRDTSAPT